MLGEAGVIPQPYFLCRFEMRPSAGLFLFGACVYTERGEIINPERDFGANPGFFGLGMGMGATRVCAYACVYTCVRIRGIRIYYIILIYYITITY